MLRHRRQSKQQLDRPQHADGRIHLAVNDATFDVRADDEACGTVRVHMIRPVLRIVLDDEDRELRPHAALRDRFHDLANRDVVRGDLCLGRKGPRCGALCVILADRHEHEVRHRAVPIHLLELLNETIGAGEVAQTRRF